MSKVETQQPKQTQGKPSGRRNRRFNKFNNKKNGPATSAANSPKKNTGLSKEVAKAGQISRQLGSRGTAPVLNTLKGVDNSLAVPTASNVISRVVNIWERSVYFSALGLVLRAIRRGAAYPEVDLYQAYLYLVDVFTKAVTGTSLEGIELPWQIWDFLAALGPKKCPFKTGYTQFSSTIKTTQNSTYKLNAINYILDLGVGFTVCLGALTNGKVEEFNIIDESVIAYNATTGAQATAKLWSFLGVLKLFTLQQYMPKLKNDPSVFSSVIGQYGSVAEGVGAIRSCLSSEVFIQSPILGKFSLEEVALETPGQIKRGFWEYRASGGGALYILPRAFEFQHYSQWHNKPPVIFKYYDFLDLFDRFACWIGRMFEISTKDNNTKDLPTVYPLSSQQTALMLRQCVMRYFENSMAMDVRQKNEPETNEYELYPFATGQQTTMRQTAEIKLPSFLAENIRAIKRMVVPTKYGEWDVVPILAGQGTYNATEYTWQSGDEDLPIFSTEVPTVINLVDLSASVSGNLYHLNVDGKELTKYILTHNTFIQQFENFSSPICDLGTENGPLILMPNHQTIMVQVVIPTVLNTNSSNAEPTKVKVESKVEKEVKTPEGKQVVHSKQVSTFIKRPSKKVLRIGTGLVTARVGEPKPTPGSNVALEAGYGVTGTTLLINPPSPVWKYKSVQWCPKRITNTGAPDLEETVEWYRHNMIEPTWIPTTTQNQDVESETEVTFTTVHQRNLAAAEMDVKSSLGKTEWENDFSNLAAGGDGGLLKTIASAFNSVSKIPFVKDAISAVDSYLSF